MSFLKSWAQIRASRPDTAARREAREAEEALEEIRRGEGVTFPDAEAACRWLQEPGGRS